jgi:hypothetical protein
VEAQSDPRSFLERYKDGGVFETFFASEIMKSAYYSGETPSPYFWRDRSENKIDFLIDRGSDLEDKLLD